MKSFKSILIIALLILIKPILTQASPDRPLTLILDWFLNADHAPLIVAEQQGFFKQQGLTVKFIQPADPMDGIKLVSAKKADIGITYQPQLLLAIDQGLPLMRFGSLVDSPLDCIVTLKSQNIHQLKDLKTKTIGYSAGGIDSTMLKTMLSQSGLAMSDITLINVRYDLVQALLSGRIHAFTGGMRNVEPIILEQAGHPAQLFYPENNGFPKYDELIFVVNKQMVSDIRLLPFLKAVQMGREYLTRHPQETWNAAIEKYPELNNQLNKASWLASITYFSKDPISLDVNKYNHFADFMYQEKLIKKYPPLESYTIRLKE